MAATNAHNTAATTTTGSSPLSPPHPQPPPTTSTTTTATTKVAGTTVPATTTSNETGSQTSGPSSPSQPSPPPPPNTLELTATNARPSAPPMKDRSVSASTDRSRPGPHHMSISPSHRLGSRSPGSIPSSPTSIHSSSSAIFERDIELPPFSSLPHPGHPMNPHRTPRSKTTETLETSVPSVLDSAATLLATSDVNSELDVAVEAPLPLLAASTASLTARAMSAAGGILGSTSPVNRGSRSPSPTTSMASRQYRTSMLLNLPSPVQGSVTLPGASSPTSSGGMSPPTTGSPNKAPPPLIPTTAISLGEAALPLPGGFTKQTTTGLSTVPAPTAVAISPRPSSEGSTEYESALSNSNSDNDDDDEATEEGQTSSPKTTTREHPPVSLPSPTTPTANLVLRSQPLRSTTTTANSNTNQVSSPLSPSGFSHPPSPSSHHGSGTISLGGSGASNAGGVQKRLSFLAYADVRSGAPVSTRPLSVLTYSNSSPPAMASPGSPGSTAAASSGSGSVGVPGGSSAIMYQEEPPHLPAVEGALEGVGVLEPSNGGSGASVLGMSFGGYGGYGYPSGYGYGYGSRSASAATSARNSLVLDSLPGVLGAAIAGAGAGTQTQTQAQSHSHAHTHTQSQGHAHTHSHGHAHAHAPSMAIGARPHSVYAHGAAADVKEPGSALEDDGESSGADVFGLVSVPVPGSFPGAGEEATINLANGAGSNLSTNANVAEGTAQAAVFAGAPATLPVPVVRAEWEREGLGRGLEERLEAVLVTGPGAGKEAAKA